MFAEPYVQYLCSVCSDEIMSSRVSCPWPCSSSPVPVCSRCLLHGVTTLHWGCWSRGRYEARRLIKVSYKVLWGALCWDVGDCCDKRKVMLGLGRPEESVSVCVCTRLHVCVCLCMRIQMGTETPRGKFPFARLALDDSFLKEGMGRRGETQKKMTNTALGF